MRKRGAAARMALCGVLAALAVALMFLGGTVPFASIACPVLASLVLIPVYCECGWKWGLLWYAAVAALAALLAPEKEAAVLFVFFGYYPMLRKLIGRLRVRAAAWAVKLVYVNAAVFAAYGLMLYVFHLTAVMEDFEGMGKAMLAVLLVLANVTFVIYDVLIARLEIYYHVRLRPKLQLRGAALTGMCIWCEVRNLEHRPAGQRRGRCAAAGGLFAFDGARAGRARLRDSAAGAGAAVRGRAAV